MSWIDALVLAILVIVIFVELARATSLGFGIALLDAVLLALGKSFLINPLAHWLSGRFEWSQAGAYGASFLVLAVLLLVVAHLLQGMLGWSLDETFDTIVGFGFAVITAVTLAHGLLQFLMLHYPQGTPIPDLIQQSWLARQCLYYEILGQFGQTMRNLGNY